MAGLGPNKVHKNKIVWPGTHDSTTNKIGISRITRPFAVEVVINDIKKFLSETKSKIIILEIRTEFGHQDPPELEKYLEEQLGEFLSTRMIMSSAKQSLNCC
ncbi:hypothetical protein REPUB_Repub01dG0127000 [Reevesia pubescens]